MKSMTRVQWLHEINDMNQCHMNCIKCINCINEEINNAESKVDGTKSSFYGSYQVVSSQMEEDLKKIRQKITLVDTSCS